MRLRPQVLIHTLPCIGAVLAAAMFTNSCAELGSWTSFGDSARTTDARGNADTASVSELTIMAGRYSVMLDQARSILKLPEPAAADSQFASDGGEGLAERKALAAQQVLVAHEFYADTARACTKRRVPSKLRAMACRHRAGVPAELRQPAALDVAALSARNEALDKVVLPWWDAACAAAPKSGAEDEPVCPME